MTQPDLARLEGLLANATPAPWGREDFTPLESDYSKIGHCNVILAPDGMSIVADLMKDPDIELVLAMHEALPALLARVRELSEALEPFAREAATFCTDLPDDKLAGEVDLLTLGDFRRAALTLNKEQEA